MAVRTVPSLIFQVEALREELYNRASSILRVRRTAFKEMSIRLPRTSPAELAFYQVVTWLYGFYYEAGRVSLRFLTEKLSIYDIADQGSHTKHYEDVQRLRTYLQHNLNLDSKTDVETQHYCEEWFFGSCCSRMPGADKEWDDCSSRMLGDSIAFLNASINCVRSIERDESPGVITQQWLGRLSRYHPRHEFEALVAIVIHDLGQDFLDVGRITARFYDKWSSDLLSRSADYVFEEEARRLIEQTILSEAELPPPISGQDVMTVFGVPPGREVRKILEIARVLYLESPCNKEELLTRLRDSVYS